MQNQAREQLGSQLNNLASSVLTIEPAAAEQAKQQVQGLIMKGRAFQPHQATLWQSSMHGTAACRWSLMTAQ